MATVVDIKYTLPVGLPPCAGTLKTFQICTTVLIAIPYDTRRGEIMSRAKDLACSNGFVFLLVALHILRVQDVAITSNWKTISYPFGIKAASTLYEGERRDYSLCETDGMLFNMFLLHIVFRHLKNLRSGDNGRWSKYY